MCVPVYGREVVKKMKLTTDHKARLIALGTTV